MDNLSKLEDDLWEAADQLRANGNVPYNEFFMPVTGIIFLRHAANRFEAVDKQIQAERASGQMKRAPVAWRIDNLRFRQGFSGCLAAPARLK